MQESSLLPVKLGLFVVRLENNHDIEGHVGFWL